MPTCACCTSQQASCSYGWRLAWLALLAALAGPCSNWLAIAQGGASLGLVTLLMNLMLLIPAPVTRAPMLTKLLRRCALRLPAGAAKNPSGTSQTHLYFCWSISAPVSRCRHHDRAPVQQF